jgi:hypothetical protein
MRSAEAGNDVAHMREEMKPASTTERNCHDMNRLSIQCHDETGIAVCLIRIPVLGTKTGRRGIPRSTRIFVPGIIGTSQQDEVWVQHRIKLSIVVGSGDVVLRAGEDQLWEHLMYDRECDIFCA